jgi:TolB protein
MRQRLFALAAIALTAASLTAAPPQQDQVSLVIGKNGQQPRLAIPDFLIAGNDAALKSAARTVADVLWQDMEFEEEFYMIPADVARAVPPAPSPAAVPVAEWEQRGADFVLVASAKRVDANMPIEVHVISVGGPTPGKDILALTYPCQTAYLRACAHSMADSLHKNLRRYEGVAMSRLAFSSDRSGDSASNVLPRPVKEIYIADYDGAGVAPVTNNRDLTIDPAWSPDGRTLAYVSYAGGKVDIYVKSIYEAKAAWRPAGGPAGAENRGPAFSPDGSQIAFYSNRDGTYQLYIVATDGKSPARRLTNTRAYEQAPTWSPDGAHIAFMSDRVGGNTPLLYTMNPDGTGQDAVACGSGCVGPSWSPVGPEIAFTCGTTRPFNICTVNLLTSKVQKLLPDDGASNERPTYAPNGRHIAFSTSKWGKAQIAIMDIKGKIQRQVTNTGNNDWPSWSRSKSTGR